MRIVYALTLRGKPPASYVAVDLYPEGHRYPADAEVVCFGEVPLAVSIRHEIEVGASAFVKEGTEGVRLLSPETER